MMFLIKFGLIFLRSRPLPGIDDTFVYIHRETQREIIMLGGYSPFGSLLDSVVVMISKASFFGSTNKDGLICSYYKKS
jgi:hypothetical protein